MTSAREEPTSHRRYTARRKWPAVAILAAVLALAGCATPAGAGFPSPSASATAVEFTPTAVPTSTAIVPEPTPSESATVSTPYNGDVLIVTAEIQGADLQVTAMVPGVSESNGTCALELLDSGAVVTVPGTAGNEVTYCGLMSIPADPAAGEVGFRVSYQSDSTRAQSAASTIESAQ